MGKTVIAAMSGGVDSSAAAALLLEQGYRVIGVTMNVWPEEDTGCSRSCCSTTDIDDARFVCAKLGIPHYVLNMREIFKRDVIDYFAAEYMRGRTPNPCIACNAHMKFEALLHKAEALGADYIATGHYARLARTADGSFRLRRSADARKDQTYVLYMLDEGRLAHVLLPCGGYTKPEIRAIAENFGLPTFRKPDSQDLCFIGPEGYAGFIRENCGALARPGDIVGPDGRLLGRHDGVFRFTVGQHKGLGAFSQEKLFVTRIDAETARVFVGPEEALYSASMQVADLRLPAPGALSDGERVGVKIRYAAPEAGATVHFQPDGTLRVEFDAPQRAVTPGQAAVFYRDDMVLGGGVIRGAGTGRPL